MSAALDDVALAQTGLAALLFALVFAFGGGLHPLRRLVRDRRSIVSFSAGMSAAYVFVHLMPELHSAREAMLDAASMPLRFEGLSIYIVALVGFIGFYGLDHLKVQLRPRRATPRDEPGAPHRHAHGDTGAHDDRRGFWIHLAGFAAYVVLMAYLMVRNLEGETGPVALYALAIGGHFVTIEHALHEEHGADFVRIGRWLLAAMCLVGWLVGVLLPIPPHATALLVAFVSGAVIMNSAVMELPGEKDGRFLPFLAGGLLYALLLIPLA